MWVSSSNPESELLNKNDVLKVSSLTASEDIMFFKRGNFLIHLEIEDSDIISGKSITTLQEDPCGSIISEARKVFEISDFVTYKDKFLKKRF